MAIDTSAGVFLSRNGAKDVLIDAKDASFNAMYKRNAAKDTRNGAFPFYFVPFLLCILADARLYVCAPFWCGDRENFNASTFFLLR